MKIPSVYAGIRGRLDVPMTPMIDVVFLLLIFFVWTSSFQTIEYLLPSSLSVAAGSAEETEVPPELLDLEQVVVRVVSTDFGTQWLINGETLASLQDVQNRLMQVASIRIDIPVIVDPGNRVPLGNVIDIYDAARQAGFENIQFTTS